MPSSFNDSVPADCLVKVVSRRSQETVYQKFRLPPRPPPGSFFEVLGPHSLQALVDQSARHFCHRNLSFTCDSKAFHQKNSNTDDKGSREQHCKACASNYVESRQRYIDCSAQKQQSTHAAQRAVGGHDPFIKNLNKVRTVPVVRPSPVSPMYEIFNERNCLLSLQYLSCSSFRSSTTRIQRKIECSWDTLFFTV